MNQQIKELAADAGYPDYMTYGQDKVLERFAELIVCKCADLADTAEPFKTSDLILKHFGVRR